MKLDRRVVPFFLLAPSLFFVLLVSAYPIAIAFVYAFSSVRYVSFQGFVGLANFAKVLKDPDFYQSLRVSFVFFGRSIVIVVPVALLLAQILSSEVRFRSPFRTLLFLPWVLSMTVVALIWIWLLDANYGPITWLCSALGLQNPRILSSPRLALWAVVLANVWNTYPIAVIFFMSGIEALPDALFEAAKVDGANPLQSFLRITLPLIMPTLTVVLIQLTINYLNLVSLIYVMTGGGPLSATRTLSLYTFQHAFHLWNTSYASALTAVMFLMNLVLSLVYVGFLGGRRGEA